MNLTVNDIIIKGIFYFDSSDIIYTDHFPGNPVVPGSLIIHAFLKALQKEGLKEAQYIIEHFRFRKFVSPGEYPFNIKINKHQMKCSLFQSSSDIVQPIVTGIIKK